MKKKRKVVLVECIPKKDGQDARMLDEFLKMINFDREKSRCKTADEMSKALDGKARYYHVSAHGDGEALYVGEMRVDLCSLHHSLLGSFVTLSSCANMSAKVITRLHKSTKVSAVISPMASVGFGESALFATLFYFTLAQSPKLSGISRDGEDSETKIDGRLAQYIDAFQKSKYAYAHAGGAGAHRLFYWYHGRGHTIA